MTSVSKKAATVQRNSFEGMFYIKIGVLWKESTNLRLAQHCVCIYLNDTELERKFYSNQNLQVKLGMNFISHCKKSSQITQNQQFPVYLQLYIKVKSGTITIQLTKCVYTLQGPARKMWESRNQFYFREHCLQWGETCNTEKGPRHPGIWSPSFLCTTQDTLLDKILRPFEKNLKNHILCKNIVNTLSEDV